MTMMVIEVLLFAAGAVTDPARDSACVSGGTSEGAVASGAGPAGCDGAVIVGLATTGVSTVTPHTDSLVDGASSSS